MSVGSGAVAASKALAPTSFHQSELIVVIVIGGLLLAALSPSYVRGALAGAVVVAEAAVLFAIPLSAWPTHVHVDTRAERFITANAGNARVFGFGVPAGNFGTLVGVSQLNEVDLPVPKAFETFALDLDPWESPTSFSGVHRQTGGAPSSAVLFISRLPLYERLGVRLVVVPAQFDLFASADKKVKKDARRVYDDGFLAVWRLAKSDPVVSAHGCAIAQRTEDSYVTTCPRPTLLVRTELFFPGWAATVNGSSVPVKNLGTFQAVVLPKGRSTVAFTYLPPGEPAAGVAALVGVVALLVPWELLAIRRRRRREEVARLDGLEALAALLVGGATPAGDDDRPLDPSTGVILVPAGVSASEDESRPTSAVPVPSAESPAVPEEAPTPEVAVVGAAATTPDPPTIAVPLGPSGPGAET
jgi:hypothetical protein